MSVRKLAGELDISNGSVARILKQDLGYRSYKKRVQPALTDFEKSKTMKFANWLRHNFRKEDTLTILFSDEILMACTMLKIIEYGLEIVRRSTKEVLFNKSESLPRKEWCWVGDCSIDHSGRGIDGT